MKKAVVFGVTGQDGSYLAEFLLSKGYSVLGAARRSSSPNTSRLKGVLGDANFELAHGDVTDHSSVCSVLEWGPDEVYNLAGQSQVGVSFKEPLHSMAATGSGAVSVLEGVRRVCPKARFYQASSSEMFGSSFSVGPDGRHQDENTPMLPNSPYAIAKLAGHHACRVYRESYGVFACSGILFNHESPRRPEQFVTRKVAAYAAARARSEREDRPLGKLRLGNLDARRDWGFAGDYVGAMWLMLQQDFPGDYVVATGECHSVRELLAEAFAAAGCKEPWESCVEVEPSLLRPCEVPFLRGSAAKAKAVLGWSPSVDFRGLVRMMVEAEGS